MKERKKVLVGISGGVDSSVSALLLKKEGYKVEGVFIKVWQPDFVECNWREEMRDAMRVCAQLEIPFHFLDLEKEYKKEVVDYMIDEYKKGRTPNPDIMCNKCIKFGHLFDFAEKNHFDFIATGHYAQNIDGKLYRGKDTNKDQSYFLWALTKDKLEKILFPIGHLEKNKVRRVAKKNNLFTSTKKDSQGICFMGPVDMKEFLSKYLDIESGKVLNKKGEVVGVHDGAVLYTIGERHGFEINKKHKSGGDTIAYVIDKDVERNTITIGRREKREWKSETKLSDISFVNNHSPNNIGRPSDVVGVKIEFQTRYRQKTQKGVWSKGTLEAVFDEEPVPGQSVVFYKGNLCLGGGIIKGP
jgi:tRNA-uridine 2-sulfurtransferase